MHKDLLAKRLKLRAISVEDFDLIRHLDIDPKVKKYIGPPSDKNVTDQRMQKIENRNGDGSGLGYWMGELLESGEAIGWFVLNNIQDTDEIEIGYRLVEKFWGNGYATEGTEVLLKHGFLSVGLENIIGLTHPKNEASKKVLLKVGLREKGIRFYYDQDVTYFELSKKEYIDAKKN